MIKEPPNGVRRYAQAMAKIYFPNGQVCCDLCPLLEVYARKQCRQTGEYLSDTRSTGIWCPLIIKEGIVEEQKNEKI